MPSIVKMKDSRQWSYLWVKQGKQQLQAISGHSQILTLFSFLILNTIVPQVLFQIWELFTKNCYCCHELGKHCCCCCLRVCSGRWPPDVPSCARGVSDTAGGHVSESACHRWHKPCFCCPGGRTWCVGRVRTTWRTRGCTGSTGTAAGDCGCVRCAGGIVFLCVLGTGRMDSRRSRPGAWGADY